MLKLEDYRGFKAWRGLAFAFRGVESKALRRVLSYP
jgi:hypothetical protein